ncbi:MAG: hypothetical protein ACPLRM_00595, partial [Anaerolineae bacterium]
MLTKTQRRFRKEMAKMRREGILSESPYDYFLERAKHSVLIENKASLAKTIVSVTFLIGLIAWLVSSKSSVQNQYRPVSLAGIAGT